MKYAMIAALVAGATLFVVFFVARLVLPACGVAPFAENWTLFCPAPEVVLQDDQVQSLQDERRALEQRIARLQDQLDGLQCAPAAPPPPAPTPEEQWEDADLRLLEGCWRLENEYRTRDRQTGDVNIFRDWTVCFAPGSDGRGTQVMRSTDGDVCEGEVQAAFTDAGQLVITETENLECSGGYSILRRETTCDYGADSVLQCRDYQPESGGRSGSYVMRPEE